MIFSNISLAYQYISENNIFDNLEELKNIDFGILKKKEFIIPEKYGEVVPFMAGQKIKWSVI